MPSRKQRRRRAKERRHEYEVVYVDQEGREVEVDPEELKAQKGRKKEAAEKPPSRNGRKPAARGAVRPVPPPSWQRVIKRAAIVAPFMLIGLALLARKLTWGQRIYETVFLVVLFVPFAYMIDRMMYRRYLRQTGQEPPERPARKPRERSG